MKVLSAMARRSVRTKLAVLLVAASLLPLGLLAWHDSRAARQQFVDATEKLLAARADELARRVDGFNDNFRRSAQRLARMPAVVAASADLRDDARAAAAAVLVAWCAGDSDIRGAAVLDPGV